MKLKSICLLLTCILSCNYISANSIVENNNSKSALLYIIYQNDNPQEHSSKFFCDIKINKKNIVTLSPNNYVTIQVPTGYCNVEAHVYMSEEIPELIIEIGSTTFINENFFSSNIHQRGIRVTEGELYYILIKESTPFCGSEKLKYIDQKSEIKKIKKNINNGYFKLVSESAFMKEGDINITAEIAKIKDEINSLQSNIKKINKKHSNKNYLSNTDPGIIENEFEEKVNAELRITELEEEMLKLKMHKFNY